MHFVTGHVHLKTSLRYLTGEIDEQLKANKLVQYTFKTPIIIYNVCSYMFCSNVRDTGKLHVLIMT